MRRIKVLSFLVFPLMVLTLLVLWTLTRGREGRVVRIIVEQKYEKADKVSLPFFEYTKKILERHAGYRVVEEGARDYNATLKIEAKGIPRRIYYGYRMGWFWTSATLKGKISLSTEDKIFSREFSYEEEPCFSHAELYLTPNEAPFQETFYEGFLPALFSLIADLRGISPLKSALRDNDQYVRKAAVRTVGELKDPRVIKLLAFALRDESNAVQWAAAQALQKIDPKLYETREAKRAVPNFISALKNDYLHFPEAAVRALGELKDPRAIKPLISLLKDDYSDVREAAEEALEKINPKWYETREAKRAVPKFISALGSDYHDIREAAEEALKKINPKWYETREAKWAICKFIFLFYLVSQFRDDPYIREEIAEKLKMINPRWYETREAKWAVTYFILALKSGFGEVRRAAALALGKLKDPRAVEPLISALKDKDPEVRGAAVEALGELQASPAVELLISLLKDEDRNIRIEAIIALKNIKDPRAFEPLTSLLKREKNSFVRYMVLRALGELKDPRAVEPIISALKDKEPSVRRAVARLLGELKDPRAVEPLISALKDPYVREAAVEALGKLKDRRAVEPIISLLKKQEEHIHEVAKAIERINIKLWRIEEGKEALPNSIPESESELVIREFVWVCKAAAEALGELKDRRAVEPLISLLELLQKEKEYIHYEVVKTLAKIDPKLYRISEVKRALRKPISTFKNEFIKCADTEFMEVWYAVVWALGELKDPRAIKPLISLLMDRCVHWQAAQALERINPKWYETREAKRAVRKFISALKDKDPYVREAAVRALGGFKDPRAVELLIPALEDEARFVRQAAAEILARLKSPPMVEPLTPSLLSG